MNLDKNDPDYFIETFWYGFKQSILNFYDSIQYNNSHITIWSDNLNKLKKEKKYSDIEIAIREHITSYAFDLIKLGYSFSSYNDFILISNINRWNHISIKFNFIDSVIYSKVVIVFMIYLQIKKMNQYKFLETLGPIEKILENNNFDNIVLFALKNNKAKILDYLRKIKDYNVITNINRLVPELKVHHMIKMYKLCNKYNMIK